MSPDARTPASSDAASPTVAAAPVAETPEPREATYLDWRERLSRNLSRRSVGRWEPLTHPRGTGGSP